MMEMFIYFRTWMPLFIIRWVVRKRKKMLRRLGYEGKIDVALLTNQLVFDEVGAPIKRDIVFVNMEAQ